MKKILGLLLVTTGLLAGCGTLDSKTMLLNVGDSKQQVINVMGTPDDRQVKGVYEAWQYCVSGASFGSKDHKIIWIQSGVVTGINSYKSHSAGCSSGMREVRWETAPNAVIEVRPRY